MRALAYRDPSLDMLWYRMIGGARNGLWSSARGPETSSKVLERVVVSSVSLSVGASPLAIAGRSLYDALLDRCRVA